MIDPSVTDSKFALSKFVGQQAIKDDLEAKIKRAKQRQDMLPHLLFCGPREIGKITLARSLAHEMKVNIRNASGMLIERLDDLVQLVINSEEGDLLVIPDIESLNEGIVELLSQVVEQFQIDITIGPQAQRTRSRAGRVRLHRAKGSHYGTPP